MPTTFDRVALENERPGGLPDYDCPVCRNKGWIAYYGDAGDVRLKECECMGKRRAAKYIRSSGLSALLEDYRFDNYETPERWQRAALSTAQQYATAPGRKWMYISGGPGTGKTHLCTAVCGALLNRGEPVRYMLWRDAARTIKALANDAGAYSEALDPYKRAKYLYIDDFLKGGATDADMRLAFELINARYVTRKATLISSELDVDAVLDLDEAVGSRIYEMAKGCIIKARGGNWRLQC